MAVMPVRTRWIIGGTAAAAFTALAVATTALRDVAIPSADPPARASPHPAPPRARAGIGMPPKSSAPRTADAQLPGSPSTAALPAFDVVRVGPDGSVVVAGHAAPKIKVALLDGEVVVETVVADANGQFVILLPPLSAGPHTLRLAPAGKPAGAAARVNVTIPAPARPAVVASIARWFAPPPHSSQPRPAAVDRPGAGTAGTPAKAVADPPAGHGTGAPKPPRNVGPPIRSAKPAPAPQQEAIAAAAAPTQPRSPKKSPSGGPTGGRNGSPAAAHAERRANSGPAIAGADDRLRRSPRPAAKTKASPVAPSRRARLTAPWPRAAAIAPPIAMPQVPAKSRSRAAAAPIGRTVVAYEPDSSPIGQGRRMLWQRAGRAPALLAQPTIAWRRAAAPIWHAPPARAVGADVRTLVVRPGDNLWDISQATYGWGPHLAAILAANARLIRDPQRILPGQILVMPPLAPGSPGVR